MLVTDLLLALAALAGHLTLWVVVFNRLHALPIPCRVINSVEKLLFAIIGLPLLWAAARLVQGEIPLPVRQWFVDAGILAAYVLLCWTALLYVCPTWLFEKLRARRPAEFVSNDTTRLDLKERLEPQPAVSRSARWLSRIPGNQLFKLHVHEKTLLVKRLPRALEGLTIVHLSDLHYAGQIKIRFFQEVVEQACQLNPDVIVLTGDIIDKTEYMQWIPQTLNRLQAPLGAYFILGNHDKRVADVDQLRQVVTQQGLVYLGGKVLQTSWRGQSVLLAGNEAPWFSPPPDQLLESTQQNGALRILLAHTPDQLLWARRRGFDLMLAGHTHGGQIRLPLLGPIVCPSRYGVKYASGVFFEDPTLLHVTRGIGGLQPIRLGCPPELTKLVLVGRASQEGL